MDLTFIDLCSGIGGGHLGLMQAGYKCLACSEINKDALEVYNLLFENIDNLGDLTTLKISNIPNADVLIAGFPCQSFSILGKRQGFNDKRGLIILHLSKILKEKSIPYFIFENVKGLCNHNKGKTLSSILTLLESAGYKVFHKVLNSFDYETPQRRDRVYFIGIRQDIYNEKHKNEKEYSFPLSKGKVKISDILNMDDKNLFDIKNATFQKYLNNKYNKGRVNLDKILDKDYSIIDLRQSDLRVYDNFSPTLRYGRQGLLCVKDRKLYKITGQQSLLLQGFPPEYVSKVKDVADSKLLQLAGNAMSVNVIRALGTSLLSYIAS